jgi:hypothetical protein
MRDNLQATVAHVTVYQHELAVLDVEPDDGRAILVVNRDD